MFFCRWLFICFLLPVITVSIRPAAATSSPPMDEIRTAIIRHSLKKPSREFLDSLSPKDLNYKLREFDRYAKYDAPVKKSLNNSVFYGYLGVDVFQYKSELWVSPDPEGNAAESGMPEMGRLLAVNDNDVTKKMADQVSELIDISLRKKKVVFTVKDNSDNTKKCQLIPVLKKPPSLFWQMRQNYLIIQIKEFVSHETAVKIAALCKIKVKPDTVIIFDLRRCPGGDLFEAMAAAGTFIPSSMKLGATSNQSGVVKSYFSQDGYKINKKPWIIADSSTASAAEVFSGILKSYGTASIAGNRTYGKCMSQTPLALSDGGTLWLTNLEVNFRDGSSCNNKGIEPDIVIQDVTIMELSCIIEKIKSFIFANTADFFHKKR